MLLDLPTAARYNQWANKRIYIACGGLTADDLALNRRGFFGSIIGTLNHILLADLIYRERLERKPTTYARLDQVLYHDFKQLRRAHTTQDDWYIEFCDKLDPQTLDGNLSFDTVETGEFFSLPLRSCLSNLYQHQIHHRGQVHHMLSHAQIEPPPLDFIKFSAGE